MKSSTKIIIGVVVVALVGAGVYFGNTKLQKGSFSKQAGLKNICKSAPTSLYSNQPQDIKNYDHYDFIDFYNYLKKELNAGGVLCPYIFELSETETMESKDSTLLSCKSSEVYVSDDGNKTITCWKPLNNGGIIKGVLYFNQGHPEARIYTTSEDIKQDISMQIIRVKK